MTTDSIVRGPDTGGSAPSREQVRAQVHGMWAAAAPAWSQQAEEIEERVEAATRRMLDAARLRPGERVLELACGPGGLGLLAAELVTPGGEVVLSDVAAEMTAIAAERAAARGLHNVVTRVLDLEDIDEPDASYDAVLCREGLMFATDPAAAGREMHRVLRPGGRVALAAWGPRDRNPWAGVAFDALRAQLGRPGLPAGAPGIFALADAGKLVTLLGEAGFADVRVTDVSVPLRSPSFEAWWERTSGLAAPLARALTAMTDDAKRELRERARELARPYETSAGLEFPGLTRVASGVKTAG